MSAHTPGPWAVDGRFIIHPKASGRHVRSGTVVAQTLPVDESQDANARLIASAPELLEALLWVRENPDHAIGNEDHSDHCPDCRRILRAIAAATGEGER